MKLKTRYNIKLALRKGVEIRSVGIDELQTWFDLYTETAVRNGLHVNNLDYFNSMFVSKMGFGGEMFHQLGCWDYPIDNEKYQYLIASELNMQGYYNNR